MMSFKIREREREGAAEIKLVNQESHHPAKLGRPEHGEGTAQRRRLTGQERDSLPPGGDTESQVRAR